MNEPFFTGVCTALVTPFLNDEINYPMLEVLIDRQCQAGVPAIVIAGTTGEAPTLSDPEKLEMIRVSKKAAAGRCKIIAGTGSNDTAHSVVLSRAAQEAGADGLLIVSPYYNKATPEGLFAHYLSIAQSISIPIILYNVPSRTGLDISVSVYQRLCRIPNIVGVKEATTDITKITRIRAACGPEFTIWTGCDEMTAAVTALGGKGVISVASNVIPQEMQALTRAALDGDFDTAADLQEKLLPLLDALFCQVNPIPVKTAMALIGLDCGKCRLPLTGMTPENQRKLEAILK